jgi:hypothetical protein
MQNKIHSRIAGALLALLALAPLAGSALAQKSDGPNVWNGTRTCNFVGSSALCLPLVEDGTWEVVRFDGPGGNGQADPADPCQRNDDDISLEVPFAGGWTFDLYGIPQTSCFINNNGNVSFGAGFATYTSAGFPLAGFPMVAPFWADVDTRGALGGVVYVKQGPNYLAVTWDHVGYFNSHDDLHNTFQLIISDGTFAPMGIGNNVCFCYDDMQWTTGDASSGIGGFGGSPATVGVNAGDGTNYFLIGQFDHPGADYQGPIVGPPYSGVDYLDWTHTCFFVGEEFNQPPVGLGFPPEGAPCVLVGETLNLTISFIGPEAGQTVTTVVNDFGLANFSYISTDGNPSTVAMTFTPTSGQVGTHTIHFTATDNGAPPRTTERDLILCVEDPSPTEPTTWGRLKSRYRN